MASQVTLDEAVDIAKRFAHRIRAESNSEALVYLYGSVVKAQNNSENDIDIAVVSKVFTDDVCNNYALVIFCIRYKRQHRYSSDYL